MKVVLLDPYATQGQDSTERLTETSLLDSILARLVHPPLALQSEQYLMAINGSAAAPADESAWRILFQRMNERRNSIVQQVSSALLLCVTPRLHALFAHEAPDFWSIRRAVITLDIAVLQPDLRELRINSRLTNSRPVITWTEANADTLAEAVVAARKRAESLPDDVPAARALSIQLDRWGDSCMARGDSPGAIAAYNEALKIGQRLATQDPHNAQWQRDLSVSHMRLGSLLAEQNQRTEALAFLEKAQALSARLVQQDPLNAVWKSDMAWVEQRIAELQ